MFNPLITSKIILCICFLFVVTTFAEFSFDQWTTENGLPQNTVRQIVQTPDGYLWMTTFDGLVRFDGIRFTVFNAVNTKEIPDNRFVEAFVDKDGMLWASMLNHTFIRYKQGRFEHFQSIEKYSKRDPIKFGKDKNGKVIINTDGKWRYFDNGNFPLVSDEYNSPNNLTIHLQSGKLWTFTKNGVIENEKGKTTFYPIVYANYKDPEGLLGFQALEDKDGAFWFGDTENIYKLQNGKTQRFKVTKQIFSIGHNIIKPQIEDNEGSIWFIHNIRAKSRLYRIKDGKIENFEDLIPKSANVTTVFKDREGNIWLGTQRGLFQVNNKLIETYSTKDGLLGKETYQILELINGEILIGIGETLYSYKDGKFTQLLKDLIIGTMSKDKKGRVWITTNGGFDKSKTKEKSLLLYENGKFRSMYQLLENPDKLEAGEIGEIWISTHNKLLNVNDKFQVRVYTQKNGLPIKSSDITHIYDDKKGTIWLTTKNGLIKFDGEKFSKLTTQDGLAGNRTRTIYEDSQGVLWIGTYGNGISRFKDGKFFNYSTENGLFHNGAFQIFEDKNENFWIGGNQGIYRVAKKDLNDLATGKIQRVNSYGFGKEAGMLNEEINGGRQPAGMIANDGRFWFPTMDGIAIIDPKKIKTNQIAPNALIEEVTIDRKEFNFKDGIIIDVGKDDLEIKYTAPSFIKPEQIKFKYKLEGYNDFWAEVRTRRTAYFSNLPPGDYTFRLLAANSDGIWNEKETTIQIKVLAPFYRTNWFYALALLSVIGILILLYRYRIGQLKKQNEQQMAFSRQLISLQEAERKRIAAGLHDGLSHHLIIIKNWASIALKMTDKGLPNNEQLNEIADSSLRALNEVREITNDLRPHRIDNLGLTDTIKSMVKQVQSASGINFKFEYDVIDHLLNKEDEVTFFRVIQEYVNNIVKHSEATNASVSIRNGSNTIKVKISDDGKGFIFDDKNASNTKSGFGLTGIEERLKMLGGIQTLNSELAKGTTIEVNIELK